MAGTTFKWAAPELPSSAPVTLLSTGLNNHGAGAASAASAAQANETDLYEWAAFELVVTFASTPAANPYATIYILPTLDQSNYSDGSASVIPASGGINIPLRAVNTAQRVVLSGIPIPPLGFEVMIVNNGSTAWASSGNTLKMRRYNEQGV